MADGSGVKHHAIMIATPYPGHFNPLVDLALKLASKGFAVTFVHLEFVHHMLSKSQHGDKIEVDFFSEARESGLDIRYNTISDGFPLEFDRNLHFGEYSESMFYNFAARADKFIEKTINSDPSLIPFLVTDTSYQWSVPIAKKYNIASVAFSPNSALAFSLMYHLDLLEAHGHYPCKDNVKEEIKYLPGVKSINTKDFIHSLKESQSESILMKILCKSFEEVKKADFILHNTVHELESDILSALNKYQQNFAVGPVNFFKLLETPTLPKMVWPESDCASWLKNKPPNSVLLVSFGSFVQTSKQVIEEIANGLLLSEVNFVWVVRSSMVSDDDTNILPLGFEDAVKDKGLIVPCCDQITVLSNPAVKGFLTHCGWNSILEGMWCGVPMICYPIAFEQPTNAKPLVDDWNIGINLCEGEQVHREKVAGKIRSLMCGASSQELMQQMEKVKGIMQNAIEVGGSSENNLDQFINDLKAKNNARV